MRRIRRHTIYDAMEERGVFAANSANANSANPTTGESLYKGPVQFPKMMYHPQGLEEIKVAGVAGPGGSIEGAIKGMIMIEVQNPAEERKLREAGWWDHPSDAVHARTGSRPATSIGEQIAKQGQTVETLLAELRRLRNGEAPQLDLDQFEPQAQQTIQIHGAPGKPDARFAVGGGGPLGHDPTLDALPVQHKPSPEFQELRKAGLIDDVS